MIIAPQSPYEWWLLLTKMILYGIMSLVNGDLPTFWAYWNGY